LHSDYIMSINQALNYIYQNLDKNLTVDEIADHCCFSKYYFNRVFKLIVGENIYSFIKRMKLENAAFKLRTSKDSPITNIAIEIGYSPSNFASAFKQYFGLSASDYRKINGVPFKDSFAVVFDHIHNLKKKENIFEEIDAKIRIKRMEGMNLVYKRTICNYTRDLQGAWEIFCEEIEEKNLLDTNSRFVGISYDDPLITDEDRCIYDMCMVVDKVSAINVHRIEPGMYACYEFYGKLEKLILVFNEIFAFWLPFCKFELDNRPSLEIYQEGVDEKGNISVEICIPIKSSQK
jgi:AraC family transcriptional regulator